MDLVFVLIPEELLVVVDDFDVPGVVLEDEFVDVVADLVEEEVVEELLLDVLALLDVVVLLDTELLEIVLVEVDELWFEVVVAEDVLVLLVPLYVVLLLKLDVRVEPIVLLLVLEVVLEEVVLEVETVLDNIVLDVESELDGLTPLLIELEVVLVVAVISVRGTKLVLLKVLLKVEEREVKTVLEVVDILEPALALETATAVLMLLLVELLTVLALKMEPGPELVESVVKLLPEVLLLIWLVKEVDEVLDVLVLDTVVVVLVLEEVPSILADEVALEDVLSVVLMGLVLVTVVCEELVARLEIEVVPLEILPEVVVPLLIKLESVLESTVIGVIVDDSAVLDTAVLELVVDSELVALKALDTCSEMVWELVVAVVSIMLAEITASELLVLTPAAIELKITVDSSEPVDSVLIAAGVPKDVSGDPLLVIEITELVMELIVLDSELYVCTEPLLVSDVL